MNLLVVLIPTAIVLLLLVGSSVRLDVRNYQNAVSQVAQTSLRSVIGRVDLDTLLQINAELKAVIDGPTEQPWGLHIERVEIKDISLPRQAEAERVRRARVIAADGEFRACARLADTAQAMAATPAPCH